jgi:Tfp pilus assembly PilM family ATPase
MKGTERYLAFIIERTHVTAVEIAHSPRGKTLTAAGSFDSSINFDSPDIYHEAGMATRERTLVKEIQAFMKTIGAGAHFFSFGLNSKMAMVQSIPIEQSLTDEEFNVHLQWELQNFYPDANPEQFIIMPYALVNDAGEPDSRAMIVAVRKSFLNFLNGVCEKLNGSLHIVDIDHFCAENCITFSSPHIASKRTAVIGIDEETFDASLLIGGKNSHIQTIQRNGDDFSAIDQYARERNVDAIYVHGRIITPEMVEQLQQFTSYPVELSDPFRKVALPATLINLEEIKTKRQEYTAAVGLAVREE